MYIGDIRHRAMIDVDENGTEAVAATAIVMVTGGFPRRSEDPEGFRIDRPFLFYITDTATGAIHLSPRRSWLASRASSPSIQPPVLPFIGWSEHVALLSSQPYGFSIMGELSLSQEHFAP